MAKQQLPLIPGGEVAGRTPDGRRVAALVASGGYAERIALPEAVLVPVPDEVSDEEAAGLLLQGLTARSLLRVSARLEQGDSVVVQAAAGGTGSLAVQLAKRMGAGRVIALASSEEKRELAARPGRRRGGRLPRRRPGGGDPRGQPGRAGRRRARDERRRGVRGVPAGAGSVRSPGHLSASPRASRWRSGTST